MANLILVGVDGSDSSMIAGRRAAELAVVLKSKLFVLTAFQVEGSKTAGSGRHGALSAEQMKAVIQRAQAEMRNIAVRAEATANRAADELRDIAPDVEAVVRRAEAGDAIFGRS